MLTHFDLVFAWHHTDILIYPAPVSLTNQLSSLLMAIFQRGHYPGAVRARDTLEERMFLYAMDFTRKIALMHKTSADCTTTLRIA